MLAKYASQASINKWDFPVGIHGFYDHFLKILVFKCKYSKVNYLINKTITDLFVTN